MARLALVALAAAAALLERAIARGYGRPLVGGGGGESGADLWARAAAAAAAAAAEAAGTLEAR
jgi:hypothetical protein